MHQNLFHMNLMSMICILKENDLSNINNIILIVFGIYIIISMATIILLILKLSKKKTIS